MLKDLIEHLEDIGERHGNIAVEKVCVEVVQVLGVKMVRLLSLRETEESMVLREVECKTIG